LLDRASSRGLRASHPTRLFASSGVSMLMTLGDLMNDFDFNQAPLPPLVLKP
jgi:hypothetical protein